MTNRSWVVTVSTRGTSRSQLWSADAPLPLGHPFRWVAERTETGIRLREIAGRRNQVVLPRSRELTPDSLKQGLAVELCDGISVSIRESRVVRPVFEAHRPETGDIRVYSCRGDWATSAVPVGASFTGKVRDETVFKLTRSGQYYRLDSLLGDLKLERGATRHVIGRGKSLELTAGELADTTMSLGQMKWIFANAPEVVLPEALARDLPAHDPEATSFKNSLMYAGAALMALLVASAFWPQSRPAEEPVAPQFAKIVLQKPKEIARVAPAPSEGSSEHVKVPHHHAVAQAFRSNQLQSAASGLLRGGMSKLLKQSEFVMGDDASDNARKLFNSKSNALTSTAPVIGMGHARSVSVASLGGGGEGGGHGVGYGHGDHASVNGQGRSFVGIDTSGSSVDEGLTKEQVGEIIHRHMGEIRYCYEAALLRFPDIEGKLMMGFTIGGAGSVRTADVKNSTVTDPKLDDCILRRLVTWRFPHPRGGIDVAVTYPFIFKSLGR